MSERCYVALRCADQSDLPPSQPVRPAPCQPRRSAGLCELGADRGGSLSVIRSRNRDATVADSARLTTALISSAITADQPNRRALAANRRGAWLESANKGFHHPGQPTGGAWRPAARPGSVTGSGRASGATAALARARVVVPRRGSSITAGERRRIRRRDSLPQGGARA